MDHRIQAAETFTELTKKSCYQYDGYWKYDKDLHSPYIMVYDYPIYKGNKEQYTTAFFSNSLNNAFERNGLENVDIMGESVGGIIGMRSSNNPRVDRVFSLHSPILSSPLANLPLLDKYSKDLTLAEKAVLKVLHGFVDDKFGFQQENAHGYNNLHENVDLEKIQLFGSSILGCDSNDMLSNLLANMINKVSDIPSDGVVCWDKEILESRGFEVHEDETPTSHFAIADKNGYTSGIYNQYVKKQ